MIFSSEDIIDIPTLDILSYVFKETAETANLPIYIDADNPTQKFTKLELELLTRRLGAGLRESAGVDQGDTVLVCSANSIWFPCIFLGTICAGGIFTGANPAYTTGELVHQLRVSSAKVVFTDNDRLPLVQEAIKAIGRSRDSIVIIDGNSSKNREFRYLSDLLEYGELQWEVLDTFAKVSERTAVLNFSSGTTGPPKACMITHHNLVSNAEQCSHVDQEARKRQNDPSYATGDVHCAYVPLYHAMGLFQFCVLNVRRGCTSVVMPKFTLVSLLHAVQKFRVTYLLLVPPVAVQLIKSSLLSSYDLSSIQFLLCGAAPLGRDTSIQLENLFRATGAKTRQGWGMSEATCTVTIFPPDQFDKEHLGVGFLCANMQAKVVNDEGKELGFDEEGEALIRGPNIFKGYLNNEAATKEAWTEDGWLKTGDYVVVQRNGLFTIVDRKKELIKVKGLQVAPSELEAHLLECEDVQDCAVIRVQRDGQEHPQAHVVPLGKNVTEESILQFMGKRLSPHKRLTGGVIFTQMIPKSPSGKILRRLIKDPQGSVKKPKL